MALSTDVRQFTAAYSSKSRKPDGLFRPPLGSRTDKHLTTHRIHIIKNKINLFKRRIMQINQEGLEVLRFAWFGLVYLKK